MEFCRSPAHVNILTMHSARFSECIYLFCILWIVKCYFRYLDFGFDWRHHLSSFTENSSLMLSAVVRWSKLYFILINIKYNFNCVFVIFTINSIKIFISITFRVLFALVFPTYFITFSKLLAAFLSNFYNYSVSMFGIKCDTNYERTHSARMSRCHSVIRNGLLFICLITLPFIRKQEFEDVGESVAMA